MEITELHNYTHPQFEDMKQLMSELSDRVNFTQTDLMEVLKDSNCHLYVILDGEHIVGCATLCIFHSPTGTKASIEDVVVSSAYRGQHLGKQLMEYVLDQAKTFVPMDSAGSPTIELHLTSNPMRVAANKLYQSFGFQKKETNCYQMFISGCASKSDNYASLKQSITYLIGKERAEGNVEPLTAEYISRVLKVDVLDVNNAMKEMGLQYSLLKRMIAEVKAETIMMAAASGFYTTPGSGVNQVRLAYVLCKEDIQRALMILEKAIEEYNNQEQFS